jgi:hypothetical protein
MISGAIMILVVIWFYQTARQQKVDNLLYWVAGAGLLFLGVVFLFDVLNVSILESFRGSESTEGYEKDLMSVGDRKNEGGFEGAKGVLLSSFFELVPSIAGFLAVAVLRVKFILKTSFTPANLFSGITELFVSIKNSFKSTAVNEE